MFCEGTAVYLHGKLPPSIENTHSSRKIKHETVYFFGLQGEILGSTVTAFFSLYRDILKFNVMNRKLTVTKCHQLSMLIYVKFQWSKSDIHSEKQIAKKKEKTQPIYIADFA